VFVYVVVCKMVLGKAYLALQPAQGTVRMQLKAPTAEYLSEPELLPYCLGPDDDRAAAQQPHRGEPHRYRCLWLDEYRVAYPSGTPVPARVNTHLANRLCRL
jgi:hypothetical protein